MSQRNGGRARFDRQRKEKIHNRARIRELRKTLMERAASAEPRKKQ